jgi:hypothetical protein
VFALPVQEGLLQTAIDDPHTWPSSVDSTWIDADAAAAFRELSQEMPTNLRPVEAGRGGSGVAIAWTIVDGVSTLGGFGAALVAAAAATKGVWQRLRRTERGIISISAGAAALLAADAAARRCRPSEIRLLNFGPVEPNTESSYSEHDIYWAIFSVADSNDLQFYLIDDKGNVEFVGAGARPPRPWAR